MELRPEAAAVTAQKDLLVDPSAVDVVVQREQERPVAGQVDQALAGVVVEVLAELELHQNWLEPADLRHLRHVQKEAPGVLVLRDRLERFDLFEPGLHRFRSDAYPEA